MPTDPVPLPAPPLPVTAGAIPVLQSADQKRRIVSMVVLIAAIYPSAKLVHTLHLTDQSAVGAWVSLLGTVWAEGNVIWGFAKRFWSVVQPVVWTKKQAAAHPATVAVKQVQAEMQVKGVDTAVERQAKIESGLSVPTVQPSGDSQ